MKKGNGFKSIFTPEIKSFMENNYIEARSFSKLAALVNAKHGTEYTRKQVGSWFRNKGIKLNLDRGKGAIVAVGAEWVDPKGYVYVKVSTTGAWARRWKRKSHIAWEAANGKIPKGKYIIYLDNNRQNCKIENFALVDMAEHFHIMRLGLRFNDPELTKTGIAIVKHGIEIANLLKGKEPPAPVGSKKFTPEIIDFIKKQWKEVAGYHRLAELVNGHFDAAFTYTQINNFTNRQGLHYCKREKNAQGGPHE